MAKSWRLEGKKIEIGFITNYKITNYNKHLHTFCIFPLLTLCHGIGRKIDNILLTYFYIIILYIII